MRASCSKESFDTLKLLLVWGIAYSLIMSKLYKKIISIDFVNSKVWRRIKIEKKFYKDKKKDKWRDKNLKLKKTTQKTFG